jgi:hypothetical protein
MRKTVADPVARMSRYLESLFDRAADRVADRLAERLDTRIATLEVLADAEALDDLRAAHDAEGDLTDYDEIRRAADLA